MFWHRCIQYIIVVTWAYLIISNVILSLWSILHFYNQNTIFILSQNDYECIECSNFDIIHSLKLSGMITCKLQLLGLSCVSKVMQGKLFYPRNVYLTKVNDIFTTKTLKSIGWQYILQRIALVILKWLFYLSITT